MGSLCRSWGSFCVDRKKSGSIVHGVTSGTRLIIAITLADNENRDENLRLTASGGMRRRAPHGGVCVVFQNGDDHKIL
jgi:hypothetical protein